MNSLLEHEISKIIARDFGFPGSLVTVTHVDATANLIEARAHISVLPEAKTDQVVKTLNKGVYSVQRQINRALNMRPVPRISFVKDEKIQEAARVEKLLASLKKDKKPVE